MFIKAPFVLPEYFTEIIEDELNVKAVEFTDDVRAFTTYTFKPQLRTVGPKYGKQLGAIKQALSALDGNAAMDELKSTGVLKLVDGTVELTEDDLLIEMQQQAGYASESNGDVTVVLDGNLTEELIDEGFEREIISKIQTMRKEAGYEVTDHIAVYHYGNDKLADIFNRYGAQIAGDVLADSISAGQEGSYSKEWSINGETVTLSISRK
jgi:isoleucyl-tRNA synthetase